VSSKLRCRHFSPSFFSLPPFFFSPFLLSYTFAPSTSLCTDIPALLFSPRTVHPLATAPYPLSCTRSLFFFLPSLSPCPHPQPHVDTRRNTKKPSFPFRTLLSILVTSSAFSSFACFRLRRETKIGPDVLLSLQILSLPHARLACKQLSQRVPLLRPCRRQCRFLVAFVLCGSLAREG
jgi:hypothetical protein